MHRRFVASGFFALALVLSGASCSGGSAPGLGRDPDTGSSADAGDDAGDGASDDDGDAPLDASSDASVDAAEGSVDAGLDGSPPGDALAPPSPVDAGACPALTYPSGVVLQTFPDAAMTATYADHLATGDLAPTCFLDADNLLDPETGVVHPLTVDVAAHFELVELVGTEISQGYGHLVLMSPAAVASLEELRESLGVAVNVISGFRSPKHQEDTCESLCGHPLGCDGTCANNSRHMFGDAFDLPLAFYTRADEQLACDDGFTFAYLESGTHLHVDQNPAYATCVLE